MGIYRFIHPTKTGGTAVEQYFVRYYPDYIEGTGHVARTGEYDKPIIIFREPMDRFKSMYRYWLKGGFNPKDKENKPWPSAEFTRRNPNWDNLTRNVDINKYLDYILKNNENMLIRGYTTKAHTRLQSYWYTGDRSNIIVIKYQENLETTIEKLINYLNIPTNKQAHLPKINVTKPCTVNELTNTSYQMYKKYFANDYTLQDKINNEPHLFRKVI